MGMATPIKMGRIKFLGRMMMLTGITVSLEASSTNTQPSASMHYCFRDVHLCMTL